MSFISRIWKACSYAQIKLEHTVLSLMTFLRISIILALERSLLLSITKNSTYIHMDQLHIYLLGDQPMMNSSTAILLTLRRSTTGNLIRVQILTSPSHKTQVQSRRSPQTITYSTIISDKFKQCKSLSPRTSSHPNTFLRSGTVGQKQPESPLRRPPADTIDKSQKDCKGGSNLQGA